MKKELKIPIKTKIKRIQRIQTRNGKGFENSNPNKNEKGIIKNNC